MKFVVVVALFLSVLVTGCAGVVSPVGLGLIYTDVQGPIGATDESASSKRGSACASNYLGLFASGDASIEAAKRDGGISSVTSVDHDSMSVLMLYGRFCTIVVGE